MTTHGRVSTHGLRTAAVQGILWVGGDQLGRRVIDQIFTIMLARLLLPRDFGVVALAAVFISFFRIIADTNLGAAIVQRPDIDDEYLSTAFWANLGTGLLLTVVTAIAGRLLGGWMGQPLVGLVLMVLSLRFLITAGAATHYAVISRHLDYRTLSLRSVAATIVGGVLGVAMAFRGLGVWSLVAQDLGMIASGTLLLYRATRWRPQRRFSWAKFRDLWAFGGRLQLSSLFSYLVKNTDNFLVGRYLGATALGLYAFGYSMFLAPLNDVGLLNRVMFSALSRLQDDEARLRRGFLRATHFVSVAVLPVMVGLWLVVPLVVETIFSAKWLPSVPVIRLLVLAGLPQLVMIFAPTGLQAAGRADLRLRLAVFSVVCYLPAFAIGLRWGIVGVAAGYLVATIVLTPVQYRYVAQVVRFSMRDLWATTAAPIGASLVMAGAVAAAGQVLGPVPALPKGVILAVLVALGATVYAAVLRIVQPQALSGLLRAAREAAGGPPVRLPKTGEA